MIQDEIKGLGRKKHSVGRDGGWRSLSSQNGEVKPVHPVTPPSDDNLVAI